MSAERARTAWHIDNYHEDLGDVLWWTNPVSEPPFCGRPDDDNWPGYHKWWTPLSPHPEIFTRALPKGQVSPASAETEDL